STGASIKPGTLSVTLPLKIKEYSDYHDNWSSAFSSHTSSGSSSSASKATRRYTDNGAGGILENGKLIPAATINYDTGAVNLGPVLRSRTVDTYTSRNTVEKGSSKTVTEQIDGKVSVYYIQSYDDFTEKTLRTVIHSANLRILDPEKNGELVPRSLVLNI